MDDSGALPRWAPRVPQRKIRRLYENDALGLYDDELIDEVGYSLFARCESFIVANQAVHGQALCPRCSAVVSHSGSKDETLRCTCGWALTWGAYFETIQHKQLSGAEPVIRLFQKFVDRFPSACSARCKMLLIDRLIHGFHWYYKTNKPTRPVAVNLIEGRLRQVMDFLDELTYGQKSTPGLAETKAEWDQNIRTARGWYE
jgi:hypothetical protein